MAIPLDMMREKVKVVIIVQATPFNADGSLDLQGLKANTRFLADRCKGQRFVLVSDGKHG